MQSRQPLQTSGWMCTVSNSVRMMALVGQTSMQLASEQCLHTSLIMLHATPPAGVLRSWNCTCRQFWSSSRPVLSNPSRNLAAWPGSWFHSLQATSQALQPMQSVVSVKKPTVRAMCALLYPHEVRHDLGEAALSHVQVERQRHQLVHDGYRRRVLPAVHRDQVPSARLAGVRPQGRETLGVGEDGQLPGGSLTARRTGGALVDPGAGAPRAEQVARRGQQRLARLHEVRELG